MSISLPHCSARARTALLPHTRSRQRAFSEDSSCPHGSAATASGRRRERGRVPGDGAADILEQRRGYNSRGRTDGAE